MLRALRLTLVLVIAAVPAFAADTVSTGTLLDEMIDMSRLSRVADPAYTTVQFSSYDRRSQIPDGPGWFSNADGFGREPIPAVVRTVKKAGEDGIGTYVIAEHKGPGAIVRLWTARINGSIRLYLDGRKQPVFDGSAEDFLWHSWPKIAEAHGLPAGGYGDSFTMREASYFPFAFARSCRVEWTGNLSSTHFYEVEIRRYERGTRVRTFAPSDLKTHADKIERMQGILRTPNGMPEPAGGRHEIDAALAPGAATNALAIEGSGAVAQLVLKMSANDLPLALRQTILRLHFDGYSQPQVESPLGDFFGAAPGVNPYSNVPMTVAADGTMTCRFVMPYGKSVRLTLDNRGGQDVRITGSAVIDESRKWTSDSLYFFAHWRVSNGLTTGRGIFDVPFVMAHGKGTYVGTVVYLMNPSSVPTPGGNWWGEGDEKIFVDDESFPSFYGTGSEDYFNYAWSSPDLFQHAYFAQPLCTGPGTRGFVVNSRWHIFDDIPFEDSLAFFMELWHHGGVEGFSYARLSYYYGAPGTYDDHMPPQAADLTIPEYPVGWNVLAQGGAAGATIVEMEHMNGAGLRAVSGDLWSNGRAVRWLPTREGETLELSFDIKEAGEYTLHLVMQESPDAGSYTASLNGQAMTRSGDGAVDLYTPHQTQLREHGSRRSFNLEAGKQTLTLKYEGQNGASVGPAIVADFIWLKPAQRRR